jgi:hypothetical protein
MSKRLLINRTIVGQLVFQPGVVLDTNVEAVNIANITAQGGIFVDPTGFEVATARAQAQCAAGQYEQCQATMMMAYNASPQALQQGAGVGSLLSGSHIVKVQYKVASGTLAIRPVTQTLEYANLSVKQL